MATFPETKYAQWKQAYLGKAIDMDGNGIECVDVADH